MKSLIDRKTPRVRGARMFPKPLSFLLIVSASTALLSSCATQAPSVSSDLTQAQIFQRAQDASEKGDYSLSMEYYKLFQQKYHDDRDHNIWADYEIAFLYHKMGNDAKAIEFFNDLLAMYEKDPTLPDAPRILAQKVKAELEAKQKTS